MRDNLTSSWRSTPRKAILYGLKALGRQITQNPSTAWLLTLKEMLLPLDSFKRLGPIQWILGGQHCIVSSVELTVSWPNILRAGPIFGQRTFHTVATTRAPVLRWTRVTT